MKPSHTEDNERCDALQRDRIRETKELPMDLIFSDLQNHRTQEYIVQLAEQKVLIGQGLNFPTVVLSQSVAGLLAIQPQFDYAQSFSRGLAWVRIGKKWGVIDKTGKFTLVDLTFSDAPGNFSEGLARVSVSSKDGFVDRTGKLAIQPQFDGASDFSEGVAMVRIGNKRGFIDKTGKVVIEPQFDGAESFSEGLAAVKVGGVNGNGGKSGYIDKTGKFAIALQFDEAASFSEGFAAVKVGNKWGYIGNPLK